MSLSLTTTRIPESSSTNKRKREELNGLDEQEDVNDPEVQSIVTTSSSSLTQLILYDTESSVAGAALERLKQHSQFCNSVWNSQFPYSETIQNQLKLNVEELIPKPPWWDNAQWKSIVDFLTVTPKELYRSRPKLLFSFNKWIFVAQLSNYLEANEHLCFAADKLFRFVQQRRWIRGSIWDQLLPIFSKIGGEQAVHSILSVMAQTEEAKFVQRIYRGYDFHLPQSMHDILKCSANCSYDQTLLINPFDARVQMYFSNRNNKLEEEESIKADRSNGSKVIQTLQEYKSSQQHCMLTNEKVFLERLDNFSYDFISKFGHELYPFCLAGGMISMLLEYNIEHLVQQELPASDLDIWLLSGRDADNAAKAFCLYLNSRNLVNNRDYKLKKSSTSLVTVEILIEPHRRSFQFISIISSSAANVILNFDFSHLQWYCEPIYETWRGPSGKSHDVERSKLLGLDVRGTKAALVAFDSHCTLTQLPYIKPSRIGKALKRGYDVRIAKDAHVVRELATTGVSDCEYAPLECRDFISELDKKRSRQVQQCNGSNELSSSKKDDTIKLARSILPVSLMPSQNGEYKESKTATAPGINEHDNDDADDAMSENDSDDDSSSSSSNSSDDDDDNDDDDGDKLVDTTTMMMRDRECGFLMNTSKDRLLSHSNAQTDFDTLDGTRMSEYSNLLRLVRRTGLPSGTFTSKMCFAVDTSGPPCLDFRAFTKQDIVWIYNPDSTVWNIESTFTIEFPPLLAEFRKEPKIRDAVVRLSLPSVHNWSNVPIYRALMRFLQELQSAAESRIPCTSAVNSPITTTTEPQAVKNCRFDCDANTGLPYLAFIVPPHCSIVPIQHTGAKVLTSHSNNLQKTPPVKDYIGTSGRWFRMLIKFKCIRYQYWQYDVSSLTQVDLQNSDWKLLL